MKEGLKPEKHPTELVGLWYSPDHSKGATSQPSAHQGAMYPAPTCPKPREKLWYCETVSIPCAMWFNVGLKTEGKERGKEVWFF